MSLEPLELLCTHSKFEKFLDKPESVDKATWHVVGTNQHFKLENQTCIKSKSEDLASYKRLQSG